MILSKLSMGVIIGFVLGFLASVILTDMPWLLFWWFVGSNRIGGIK